MSSGSSKDHPPPSPATTTITVPSEQTQEEVESFRKIMYNGSLAVCVACPILALMPPRKFDLYTFGLGIAFFTSAGFVVEQRTGQGLLWHVGRSIPSERNRRRWRDEKEQGVLSIKAAAEESLRENKSAGGGLFETVEGRRKRLREEQEAAEALARGQKRDRPRGILKRLWMGAESDDWLEQRAKKEQEALDEGKGYGSLIADQIKEVWTREAKGEDNDEKKS